jgi:hypothetical protein
MIQFKKILADLESVSFHDISCFPVDSQHIVAHNIEELQGQLQKFLYQSQATPSKNTTHIETLTDEYMDYRK